MGVKPALVFPLLPLLLEISSQYGSSWRLVGGRAVGLAVGKLLAYLERALSQGSLRLLSSLLLDCVGDAAPEPEPELVTEAAFR